MNVPDLSKPPAERNALMIYPVSKRKETQMTRKHFESLADAIALDYAEPRPVRTVELEQRANLERRAIRRTAENVANACAQINSNFDREKFLTRALPETVTV